MLRTGQGEGKVPELAAPAERAAPGTQRCRLTHAGPSSWVLAGELRQEHIQVQGN